jgi:hypothetical protein
MEGSEAKKEAPDEASGGCHPIESVKALPGWAQIVGGLLVLLLAILLIPGLNPHPHLGFGDESAGPSPTNRRPAEFLYLDNGRAAAYLAQLEGGVENSEKLTDTLTTGAEAKASAGNFLSFGGSSQRQSFVEREVTPTAAAIFFHLLDDLRRDRQLYTASGRRLPTIEHQGEGAFIQFKTQELRTPIYANPYLVVRQAGTLPALFPLPSKSMARRQSVKHLREVAEGFARQVGVNPRLVFSIQPENSEGESKGFKLLLPIRYRHLTDERSLIQNGGGRFTVVGKVVRIFSSGEGESYVDSPTRETWSQPLKHAPAGLLLRAARKCRLPDEEEPALRSGELRACLLHALNGQTEVDQRGAVIIPVAIYK